MKLDDVKVLDIGEDVFFDRYTVVINDDAVFSMSHNPLSPQGVNMFAGNLSELSLDYHGKELEEIPEEIIGAVVARRNEYYAEE